MCLAAVYTEDKRAPPGTEDEGYAGDAATPGGGSTTDSSATGVTLGIITCREWRKVTGEGWGDREVEK